MVSFVPRSSGFDFDLAEAIAALQLELIRTFANNLGTIDLGQVPSWDVDHFIDRAAAQQIYRSECALA